VIKLNNEIISKAKNIAENASNATIAVIDEYGYPRASTVSNIKADGIETIWFATGSLIIFQMDQGIQTTVS